MEQIYLKTAPKLQNSFTYVTRSQVMEGADPEEQMLLPDSSHKLVAQTLKVPELATEVERAIRQIKATLAREMVLEQERLEMEAHHKEQRRQRK
jgi:nitrogen-specific signal transduction histidine kinase